MRKCGKILYSQTGERWHNVAHGLCVLDSYGKNTDRLCIVYCLCMATCYMFVPQNSATCTLPVLACLSLIVRTAADNSKTNCKQLHHVL